MRASIQKNDMEGKVVLITGANNPVGIGAATAKAFAQAGASVFLTYLRLRHRQKPFEKTTEPGQALYDALRMKTANEVVSAIRKEGGAVAAMEADLVNPNNVTLLFDRAEAEFGHVDVLVNNAGYYSDADSTIDLTSDIIDQTYAVNTRATLLLTAEFIRRHKKGNRKWGRIINLSTGPAQYFNTQVTYGTSKAAIEAATRAIAREVGPLGITVNCVAPGPTQTGYIDKRAEERLIPTIPLRRLGQPEDIANAILFLASDQASWITGQIIRVTGGRDL
jgi:3-oxoacyl-[acyl-carrier protein] reductase